MQVVGFYYNDDLIKKICSAAIMYIILLTDHGYIWLFRVTIKKFICLKHLKISYVK